MLNSKQRKTFLFISANQHKIPYPVYPLGISYLWSYLKPAFPDFEFHLCDLILEPLEMLGQKLTELHPDYIGISFRNLDDGDSTHRRSFFSQYRELMQFLRNRSRATIIIGGAGLSIYPEYFFQELEPDYAIFGEGEESLSRLIVALEGDRDFSEIQGLLYRKNGALIRNERTTFSRNLEPYFPEDTIDYYWEHSGMLNIQTRRGCPYRCIYCSYPVIEGRKVRTLNPGRIVDTIEHLNRTKHISYFFFTDSVFNLASKFNVELAEEIIRRKLKIQWGAYFAPHNLSLERLKLFRQSGLRHIEFGTESISDQTLKTYGKHFTVSDILQASENAQKAGIHFAHFLILAGYGETDQTIDETFRNSKLIKDSIFFPYIGMRIYPGTTLAEIGKEEGWIKPEDPLIEPRFFISPEVDLEGLKTKANQTGQKWVFPDDDLPDTSEIIQKYRVKGPLWHLIDKEPIFKK